MGTLVFDNAPSGWNEALPLGNEHFGGMVYFENNRLTIALNHYEVYYRKLERYKSFSFIVMIELIGANGEARVADESINIRFRDEKEDVTLITSVVTVKETKIHCITKYLTILHLIIRLEIVGNRA